MGLLSIRERVHALGGQFDLETAPGRGTTVRLTVPLAPAGEVPNQ
jgi:signal transduction histidine kinase